MALDKIAFLPFGLLVDKWRWEVFSGKTTPAKYNEAWWDAARRSTRASRRRPRAARTPSIRARSTTCPANTPYTRYFLAHIYQFQFHRALCQAGRLQGPAAPLLDLRQQGGGRAPQTMLAMGASRPWPEALEALTGEREMDATALVEYFEPLQDWLESRTRARPAGGSEEVAARAACPEGCAAADPARGKRSRGEGAAAATVVRLRVIVRGCEKSRSVARNNPSSAFGTFSPHGGEKALD